MLVRPFLYSSFAGLIWTWRIDYDMRVLLQASLHENARSAYPLDDVVELAEERYWLNWAFIELQNGCEGIETSRVRTSRVFMRKASKKSVRSCYLGHSLLLPEPSRRFTQLDVAWNGASRTIKFKQGRPAVGILNGVSWEVANEFRRNAS